MEVEGFEPPQQEVVLVRRSARTHQAPDRLCLNIKVEEHNLGDLNKPTNYKDAILDPESNKWLDAINEEMQSMKDNQVWCLVDLPPNCKTVRSKWLFKKKTDMHGIIHTYKARLLAKGFTQTYDVDYEETFSPVADIRAIRILIAIATCYDYKIWQMDVQTTFLNGYFDEDIYMVQPKALLILNIPRKYASFKDLFMVLSKHQEARKKDLMRKSKCLNLLKIMMSHVYIKRLVGVIFTFLVLYVDDIIIIGNHVPSLKSVTTYLGKCFAMKDLGEAAFIFGIKIYRDRSKRLIGLSQSVYMDKILKRFRMDTSKRGYISMQEKFNLNKHKLNFELIAIVMLDLRLLEIDTKSQIGYIFVLNGDAIDWKTSKQNTIAMSATKAEYVAASKAVMEAVWIRKFILRLGKIKLLKVHTDDNLADSFTNALSKGKLTQHARSMGLRLASSFM
nr:hypothetical protein [Tanacetum cinerariifolium]